MSFCFLFGSRGSTGREKNDKPLPPSLSRPNTFLRGSSSKELLLDNQAQEEQRREMLETVKQLTGAMEMDRNSTEAERSKAKEPGRGSPGLRDLTECVDGTGTACQEQGQVAVQGTVTCTSQSWVTQLSQAGLGLYPSAAPPWDPAGLRGCRCQHSPTPWHCLPCVILSLSPDQCQFFRNAMSALFKHSPGPGQGFGSGTDGAQQLFSCQPSFQPVLVQQEGGTHQGDLSVTLSVL